jgi:hypothetical protein
LSFLIVLFGCDDSKSVTETNTYNAYFVQFEPEETKRYVGTVTGLSSCKYIVSDYYAKRRKFIEGKWDYACCLKTKQSNCAEKHRYKGD